MKLRKFWMVSLLFLPSLIYAQQQRTGSVGIEFQAYPTGLIPGVGFSYFLSDNDALHLRLGYQFIDHQGFGVQDDETGTGIGGTMGYRRHFGASGKGIFAGIRCDLWRNSIDWLDYIGETLELKDSGTSKILVVQPTAEVGYELPFGNGKWAFVPSAAFGFEVNIQTDGAPTGEGIIFLIGVAFDYRW